VTTSGFDTVATLRFPWNTTWVPNGSYTIKAALKCSDPHKDGVDENPDPVAESWVHWAGSPPTATADGVAGGTTVSISVVNVVITNYRAKDTPLDSHDQDAFKYDPDAASPLCNPSFEVAIDNWTSEPMRIRVWMQATAWGDTRPVPECDPFTALDVSAAGTYTLTWNGSNPGAPPGWKGEWGTWSFDVDVYRMDPTGTWATDHFYAKTHDGWSENYDVLVDPLHHDVWWYCDQTATPPGYQFRCNYTVHSDESTQPTAVDLVTLKELTVKATQTGPVTLNTLHDNITSYPGSGNTNEDDTLGTWRTVFTGQTASGAEHRRDGTDPRILATNQAKSIIPVVESPHGDPTDLTGSAYPPCTDYAMPHQHAHNVGIWRATGLEVDHFSAKPTLAFNWQISGYVGRPNTTVTWYWHDPSGPGQTQGLGSNPVLYVDYFDPDPSDPYTDYYPPDNTWFGDRMVTVSIGGLTFVRPLRVFFKASGGVYRRQSDDPEKCVATWFYYWRLGAVPELLTRGFHYDQSLVCQAQHGWSGTGGDTFTIGPSAHAGTGKPIFDVTTGNYHEAMYPDGQGEGIHGVAKLCRHEYWHSVLRREVRATLYGGMGHADQDHDGLSDTREAEIGTNPLLADTCLIASYCAEYAEYAPEGDQELFCRWKQDGVLGDETKDWSHTGKQSIFLNASP
jgi:hypothetical protein